MNKRQQLNYDSDALVANLKASTGQGVNAFFSTPSPAPQPAQPAATKQGEKHNATSRSMPQPPDRTGERPTGRTDTEVWTIPEIPQQRRPERYAFQFWADQVTRLRKLHGLLNLLHDPSDRTAITLSDLVREALDVYLLKQTKELQKTLGGNDRADDRTAGATGERTYDRTADHTGELEES